MTQGQSQAGVSIADHIDNSPLTSFQIRVVALCGLISTLDGFDLQALAFVAPLIAAEWQIPVSSFGIVFAASLIGLMLGGMLFGSIADRFGRRKVVIVAIAIFASGSIISGTAGSLEALLGWRFLTGLGLGAALPNVIALTSEYAPRRLRATFVVLMFCGVPLGAVLGGLISAKWLIPTYGWRMVFYAGGVLPLIALPLVILALPESIRFLIARGRVDSAMTRIAAQLGRPIAAGESLIEREVAQPGLPVKQLFAEGRGMGTMLLWLAFFMNLEVMHLMMSWLPAVLQKAGFPIDRAIVGTVVLNAGGVTGGLVIGRLIDRYGAFRVLPPIALCGAVAVAAIGIFGVSVGPLMILLGIAGACVIGAQLGANSLAASYYPVSVRATGVGWALAAGRAGSIVGPLVGGMLIGWSVSTENIFLITAIPAVIAAIALFAMGRLKVGTPPKSASVPFDAIAAKLVQKP